MQNTAGDGAVPATAQLKRGMKMDEVTNLFGPGKQISESVSGDGLKTQIFEYSTGDRRVECNLRRRPGGSLLDQLQLGRNERVGADYVNGMTFLHPVWRLCYRSVVCTLPYTT